MMESFMNRELLTAARSGNLEKFKELMEDVGANILDETTPEGNTALHVAARVGHKHLVEEIIKQRPSLAFKTNRKGETPMHIAASAGRDNVVDFYINSVKVDDAGNHIGRIRDNSGNTPLHVAVRNGHFKVADSLAEKDPESLLRTNAAGESPLWIAIDRRFTILAHFFIVDNPSTLNYVGHDGQTPLHCAVMRNDSGLAWVIVENKPELIGVQDTRMRTPLHYAAALGAQWIVEILINQDPMAAITRDEKQQIPLHLAAENGQVSMIRALLDPWPDTIEIIDNKQQNVLHIAAKTGNFDAVSHILKLPEMEDLVNSPDVDGNTPLHLAATNYHSDVVGVLSKNSKVEIRAVNNSNMTALAIVKFSADHGMELQKHLTLKALKSAYKQKSLNPEHVSANTQLDNVEVERPNRDGKLGREMAQMISVMSTLIATFTFTAAFTIPGGFKIDGPDEGMATFISRSAFRAFVISDSIAMTSSITAAVITFWSSSHRDTESFLDTLPFAIGLTWISLIVMGLAFATGLFVVLQKTLWLAIFVCVLGCAPPFFLYIFSPLFLLAFERLYKSRTSLSKRQNIVEDNPFLFIVGLMKIFVVRKGAYIFKCSCLRSKRSCLRSKRSWQSSPGCAGGAV